MQASEWHTTFLLDDSKQKAQEKIYTVVNHMHILTGGSSAREWKERLI